MQVKLNATPTQLVLQEGDEFELLQQGTGTSVLQYSNKPSLVIDKKVEVDDRLFFVAVEGCLVAGTIMAGYDGHRGWIYLLAVSPAHRGQGIGSRLVSHAERALADKRCVKINLQILEGNESVAAFYASLGYVVEKRVSMGKPLPENIP